MGDEMLRISLAYKVKTTYCLKVTYISCKYSTIRKDSKEDVCIKEVSAA